MLLSFESWHSFSLDHLAICKKNSNYGKIIIVFRFVSVSVKSGISSRGILFRENGKKKDRYGGSVVKWGIRINPKTRLEARECKLS